MAIFLTCLALTKAYVLVDPITGRVLEKQSPSYQERRLVQSLDIENSFVTNSDSDLPIYSPQQRRVPAPEYYAADGKTPIYKIFRKNPYGR